MHPYQGSSRIVAVAFCLTVFQLLASMRPAATARAADKTRTTSPRPTTKEKEADGTPIRELIPLKGAATVRFDKGAYDSLAVAYGLNEKYPARDVLSQIAGRLKKLGWEPLKEDWLNPGLPSSHVRGWAEYVDGTVKPERQVHAWQAEWKNGAGDVVAYSFQYSYPRNGKADLQSLWVNGSWYAASAVAKMKAVTGNH
jgi:hypothetical protein